VISVDLSKCTGCKQCECACAFFHTGKINNRIARIKVLNLYEIGIDGPVVCNQCSERYCMKCPENALSIGEFGQIIVSRTNCNQCGACEENCPIGAFELFDDISFVCDLCGGFPKCVEACTENAISWNKDAAEHPSLADIKKETKKMNPSQKRYYYLKKQSAELRNNWRKKHA